LVRGQRGGTEEEDNLKERIIECWMEENVTIRME
jgi:hypothetical protein